MQTPILLPDGTLKQGLMQMVSVIPTLEIKLVWNPALQNLIPRLPKSHRALLLPKMERGFSISQSWCMYRVNINSLPDLWILRLAQATDTTSLSPTALFSAIRRELVSQIGKQGFSAALKKR